MMIAFLSQHWINNCLAVRVKSTKSVLKVLASDVIAALLNQHLHGQSRVFDIQQKQALKVRTQVSRIETGFYISDLTSFIQIIYAALK